MKAITNMVPSRVHITTTDDRMKANELNDFYLRFQTQDFNNECISILNSIGTDMHTGHEIDWLQIQSLFRHQCTRKAKSPDGISARLNMCGGACSSLVPYL